MLTQQLTVDQAIAREAEEDRRLHRSFNTPRRGKLPRGRKPEPTPDNYEGKGAKAIRHFIATYLLPGDTLWKYQSDEKSWEGMYGELGYAIVRDGKVVAFEMFLHN